jgi:hypothetical protein
MLWGEVGLVYSVNYSPKVHSKAVIQLNVVKVYRYTEEHGGSIMRKVVLMPSYVFLSGTALFLANTNTIQILK